MQDHFMMSQVGANERRKRIIGEGGKKEEKKGEERFLVY